MLRQFRRDARDFPCWWGLSGGVGVIATAAAYAAAPCFATDTPMYGIIRDNQKRKECLA